MVFQTTFEHVVASAGVPWTGTGQLRGLRNSCDLTGRCEVGRCARCLAQNNHDVAFNTCQSSIA